MGKGLLPYQTPCSLWDAERAPLITISSLHLSGALQITRHWQDEGTGDVVLTENTCPLTLLDTPLPPPSQTWGRDPTPSPRVGPRGQLLRKHGTHGIKAGSHLQTGKIFFDNEKNCHWSFRHREGRKDRLDRAEKQKKEESRGTRLLLEPKHRLLNWASSLPETRWDSHATLTVTVAVY